MKKRILIISAEVWRDDTNGGNVLTNLFNSFTDTFEFAQIYCHNGLPSNNICKKYFQLSEAEMVKSLFRNKSFGKELTIEETSKDKKFLGPDKNGRFSFLKTFRSPVLYTIQDILWRLSKWRTPELEKFITDFAPDIIFAPMYYSLHVHRIDRYVAELTGKKLISYVSDDHLTFKQFSLSPFFWFNRLVLRKNVFATSKYYSLLYTMTGEQLNEYERILKVPMKILKKTGNFDQEPEFKSCIKTPLVITYGGNLLYNRYKTLHKVVEAISKINQNEVLITLNTYTPTPITKRLRKLLHDGRNSFLNSKISLEELNKKYKESDIVLHVESFELKQRLLTRLSFSTKIIDLIHSARCIVAICWDKSSPFKYLHSEDAAICISSTSEIYAALKDLVDDPNEIKAYSKKAWECGMRNHNSEQIIRELKRDFELAI